jgi:hypothetical protein
MNVRGKQTRTQDGEKYVLGAEICSEMSGRYSPALHTEEEGSWRPNASPLHSINMASQIDPGVPSATVPAPAQEQIHRRRQIMMILPMGTKEPKKISEPIEEYGSHVRGSPQKRSARCGVRRSPLLTSAEPQRPPWRLPRADSYGRGGRRVRSRRGREQRSASCGHASMPRMCADHCWRAAQAAAPLGEGVRVW